MTQRCAWAGSDPLYQAYHDQEWDVPVHTDQRLFEFLVLEGAQAGLSWITILRKRESYRHAFDHFDPAKVSCYDQAKQDSLLQDSGIIRNRAKIRSAINNAQAFVRIQEAFGSFDAYLWCFVDGVPICNAWPTAKDLPAETPLSQQLSKDLSKRGFTFVGPIICYSFMQAVGMVNDHTTACFRYSEIRDLTQNPA